MRGDFVLTGDGLEDVAVVNMGDGVKVYCQVSEDGTVNTIVMSDQMRVEPADWEAMGGESA